MAPVAAVAIDIAIADFPRAGAGPAVRFTSSAQAKARGRRTAARHAHLAHALAVPAHVSRRAVGRDPAVAVPNVAEGANASVAALAAALGVRAAGLAGARAAEVAVAATLAAVGIGVAGSD